MWYWHFFKNWYNEQDKSVTTCCGDVVNIHKNIKGSPWTDKVDHFYELATTPSTRFYICKKCLNSDYFQLKLLELYDS